MTETKSVQLLQAFSDAVEQLTEKVSPSVVHIGAGRRGGTGIVWSDSGQIVTASHVVGDSSSVTIRLEDERELEAQVAGRDRYSDVALLNVNRDGLRPLAREMDGNLKVGQFVLALGNGSGKGVSATSGIVTSRGRSVRGWWGTLVEEAVVTDAKLNPGYSGGPLVNPMGGLVGMNVAYFAGRGIAVPTASLAGVVKSIQRDGKVKRGFLGVMVEPFSLPDELSGRKEIGQGSGLLVRSVDGKSPARTAGVAIGDILLRLGDTKATDEHALHRAFSGAVVERVESLWILRGEKLMELKVKPEEAED